MLLLYRSKLSGCPIFLSVIIKKTLLIGNSYFKQMDSFHHQVVLLTMRRSLKLCIQKNVLFSIMYNSAVVLDVDIYWVCCQFYLQQIKMFLFLTHSREMAGMELPMELIV